MGRYRIVGELGRGGMGVVYKAEDPQLDRSVALKVLPAHLQRDTRAKERLMVEARAAAALDHPNVCTVYEVAEEPDGRAYIAFACYDGQTLRERMQEGPLQLEEAVRIAREVAAGLAAAHDRGIVHRDLKPSNIFLCADGTAKILDFGIAKVQGVALTTDGSTPGTVEYGAPETSQGRVDARSDVWSLGVVLYEMLTGRRPFHAPYEAAVLYAVLNEDPAAPSSLASSVSPELDAVVARCLEKDPDARYPDAAALVRALAPEETRQPDDVAVSLRRAGRGTLRRLRSSRVWQAGLAAVLVGLVAVGIGVARVSDASALPDAMHLAILPFAPTPDEPDDRALALGLADDLASGVVQAPGTERLRVVPFSEIKSEQVETAREAWAELGVNLVVEGRIERKETGLVVVLKLIRTDGDQPVLFGAREFELGSTSDGTLRSQAVAMLLDLLDLAVPADASVAMEDAYSSSDPEAVKLYTTGLGYLIQDQTVNDLDDAIALFERAIARDSMFASAYARLGEAYIEKWGDQKDPKWIRLAEAASDKAIALDPDNPLPHVAMSRRYTTVGEYARAITAARGALELDRTSYDANLALGDAENRNGDTVGAIEAYRAASQLRQGQWTALARLGYIYYGLNNLDSASAQFERILKTPEGNYQAASMLGIIAKGRGDTTAARTYLERAADIRPGFSVYTNLAAVATDAKQYEQAVRLLNRALSYDSTDHRTWNNLASAYSDIEGAEAKRHWRDALNRAVELAESQLTENPNDATVLAWLAGYHALLGNKSPARAAASRAVTQAPDDVDVQFRVGYAYAVIGDNAAALPCILFVLKMNHKVDQIKESRIFLEIRKSNEVQEKLQEIISKN